MNLTKLDKNKVQGFTLIEAIVSLALFAIAFSFTNENSAGMP